MFGGETNSGLLLNDMYMLNVERMHWSKVVYKAGNVPKPRILHTATAVSNNAMVMMFGDAVVSGADNNNSSNAKAITGPLDDVWLFDIRDYSWKRIPSSPTSPPARSCHSAVFGSGLGQQPAVYVFGGFGGGSARGSPVYRLKIRDWKWEKLPVYFKNRDGKEIVVSEPGNQTDPDRMNGTQIDTGSFPFPRESHGSMWLPGLNGMLVMGGDEGYGLRDDCWLLAPYSRKQGVWRWRRIHLKPARNLPQNRLPAIGGFTLIDVPTEKTQVLVWGGILGDRGDYNLTPRYSYLIDLDGKITTCLAAKGDSPSIGRLLHGFVRVHNRFFLFGGCDDQGNVMKGLRIAKMCSDFRAIGLNATDFGPLAGNLASGVESQKENGVMPSEDRTLPNSPDDVQTGAVDASIPLLTPSGIPKGTPLSGRILDVSDYGYFVSVVIKGKLYKGVLVANPLNTPPSTGNVEKANGVSITEAASKPQEVEQPREDPSEKEVVNGKSYGRNPAVVKDEAVKDEPSGFAAPHAKRPRLDPASDVLSDAPLKLILDDNEVITLD